MPHHPTKTILGTQEDHIIMVKNYKQINIYNDEILLSLSAGKSERRAGQLKRHCECIWGRVNKSSGRNVTRICALFIANCRPHPWSCWCWQVHEEAKGNASIASESTNCDNFSGFSSQCRQHHHPFANQETMRGR